MDVITSQLRPGRVKAMIDTLSIAADLAAAGIDKRHAEAQAKAIASAVGDSHGDLATKDFVDAKINALETRLVRWIVGAGFAFAALIVAALRLLA